MAKNARDQVDAINERLQDVVSKLEQRTRSLVADAKVEGRKAEALAQENLWVTLAITIVVGLGFLLSLVRR